MVSSPLASSHPVARQRALLASHAALRRQTTRDRIQRRSSF
jgi:hypothetical protein